MPALPALSIRNCETHFEYKSWAKAQSIVKDAHDGDVNSLSFCPHNEFLLVTAGGDRAVKLWDMRNLKAPQHVFEGHKKEVYVVEWCADKNCKTIMASCAADRRVNVWDISRIGQEQAPEDAEDGPPELLAVAFMSVKVP